MFYRLSVRAHRLTINSRYPSVRVPKYFFMARAKYVCVFLYICTPPFCSQQETRLLALQVKKTNVSEVYDIHRGRTPPSLTSLHRRPPHRLRPTLTPSPNPYLKPPPQPRPRPTNPHRLVQAMSAWSGWMACRPPNFSIILKY